MSGPNFDVAVIGSGIAGLTAANHAAVGGVSVGLFADEADLLGGLVANVGSLDSFPAIGSVAGMQLALSLSEQGAGLGIRSVPTRIAGIEQSEAGFRLNGPGGTWTARRVIVASGARLKTLAIPGAETFKDRGVLQCAWCNAGLYRNEHVVVVGGGNAALQEALHVAKFAAAVTIVTHGDKLRAGRRYVTKAASADNISFRWDAEPIAVLGDDGVQGIRLRDRNDGSVEEVPCSGIFVFIGLAPNSEFVGELVERDAAGGIITGEYCETATPGLFAVGAVRSRYLGRLANAVGEASAAAITAARGLTG
jgi:thioredoxin reductase (NADPH)